MVPPPPQPYIVAQAGTETTMWVPEAERCQRTDNTRYAVAMALGRTCPQMLLEAVKTASDLVGSRGKMTASQPCDTGTTLEPGPLISGHMKPRSAASVSPMKAGARTRLVTRGR